MERRTAFRHLASVLLISAAALPLAAITPAPSGQTCDAVMQWARDNRDSLPRDYRSLLAFPLDQRRAIYTHLTAAEKANFWSDRIGLYLEEHPKLTAGQLRAAAEARDFLKADIYEVSPPSAPLREQQLSVFMERMNAGLGEKVAQELLYGLGPEAAGPNTSLAPLTCVCLTDSECTGGRLCLVPNSPCSASPWGCGPGGARPCTRMCFDPP